MIKVKMDDKRVVGFKRNVVKWLSLNVKLGWYLKDVYYFWLMELYNEFWSVFFVYFEVCKLNNYLINWL